MWFGLVVADELMENTNCKLTGWETKHRLALRLTLYNRTLAFCGELLGITVVWNVFVPGYFRVTRVWRNNVSALTGYCVGRVFIHPLHVPVLR